MKYIKYLFLTALIIMLPVSAFAHPGNTDAWGGHYDRSTGTYHYHHGYSAHSHPNGICPYEYQDNSSSNYDENGNYIYKSKAMQEYMQNQKEQEKAEQSKIQYSTTPSPTPIFADTAEKNADEHEPFVSIVLFVGIVYGIVYSVFIFILSIAENTSDKKYSFNYEPNIIDYIVCLITAITIAFYKDENNALLIAILFILYTIYSVKKFRKKIKQKIEEDKRLEQIKFNEEKAVYTQWYGGKDIRKFVNVPKDVVFDKNGLPQKFINGRDIYTVYISSQTNASLYHRSSNCLKKPYKVNYYYAWQHNLRPCKKCQPTTDDMQWYTEYKKIKNIKEKYDID